MSNFLYRMRLKMQNFMRGRYGMDLLNNYLLYTILGLDVINLFIHNSVLSLITTILLIVFFFRTFSRNYVKRSIENTKFTNASKGIRRRFKALYSGIKDRNHHYYVCPGCKQIVRVPKGRGKIVVTCPKCGREFTKRS